MDAINAQQLRALPGEARRFAAQDVGSPDVLAAACPARRTLELKVGRPRTAGMPPDVHCGHPARCALQASRRMCLAGIPRPGTAGILFNVQLPRKAGAPHQQPLPSAPCCGHRVRPARPTRPTGIMPSWAALAVQGKELQLYPFPQFWPPATPCRLVRRSCSSATSATDRAWSTAPAGWCRSSGKELEGEGDEVAAPAGRLFAAGSSWARPWVAACLQLAVAWARMQQLGCSSDVQKARIPPCPHPRVPLCANSPACGVLFPA